MTGFKITKPMPGASSAADAFAAGAAGGDAAQPSRPAAPPASAAASEPAAGGDAQPVLPTAPPASAAASVASNASSKLAPRPFMLRLPPALAERLEAAYAASPRGDFSSRQDMLLKLVECGLTNYLAGRGQS